MDRLKICLLDMLSWFHEYCVANHLRYYLVEGTMLGAARHQGYIPWDDDIDIGMPRPDYEALKKSIGGRVQDGKYLLETEESENEDYFYLYSKLYDTGTTQIEDRRVQVVRGVGIDIFPLDGIGDTEEEAQKNFKRIGFLTDVLTSRVVAVRDGRKWYKNLAVRLFQAIPRFMINEKKLMKKISLLCQERAFDDCEYVGGLVTTYRAKEIMPRSYYGEPALYQFENIKVYGVRDYDRYLTHLYGDWRKLPPVDQRHTAHLQLSVDLDHSYLERKNEV